MSELTNVLFCAWAVLYFVFIFQSLSSKLSAVVCLFTLVANSFISLLKAIIYRLLGVYVYLLVRFIFKDNGFSYRSSNGLRIFWMFCVLTCVYISVTLLLLWPSSSWMQRTELFAVADCGRFSCLAAPPLLRATQFAVSAKTAIDT